MNMNTKSSLLIIAALLVLSAWIPQDLIMAIIVVASCSLGLVFVCYNVLKVFVSVMWVLVFKPLEKRVPDRYKGAYRSIFKIPSENLLGR